MEDRNAVFTVYGVRGSIAAPKAGFMEFGGNTSSYTLRTPSNTLIFLDAGTGIQYAANELKDVADKVLLAISHVHADHISGLAMSPLPWLPNVPYYQGRKVHVAGPEQIFAGLRRHYDGEFNWPVHFSDSPAEIPNMPGIDVGGIEELVESCRVYHVDDSTSFRIMKGNHPVKGGVVLFRFEIQQNGSRKSLVYATDNEFDFVRQDCNRTPVPNENAEPFKATYAEFIRDADLLVADAQFTKEEYLAKNGAMNVRGFGHSYTEQVIDLASRGNVKRLMLTHVSSTHTDTKLTQREEAAKQYAADIHHPLEVLFAKEGARHIL